MVIPFYILFIFYIVFAVYFALKRNINMLLFFLIAIFCQNLICIVVFNYVSASTIKSFTLIKEMMLYLSIVFFLLASFKIKIHTKSKYFLFVSLYILAIIWNFFFSPAPIQARILVARFLVLPIICIGIGKSMILPTPMVPKLLRSILYFGIFLAISGIIEYKVGDSFWTNIGYSQYAIDIKGNTPWGLINGVTANFYTYDFGPMLRRVVTHTADPLASAFLISLAFGIATFKKSLNLKHKRFNFHTICWFVLAIICILTLSKAVFINMAILMMIKLYYNKNIPKSISKLAYALFIGVIVINVKKMIMGADNSVAVHFNGFINGIMSSGLFGNGLGTAGASASMLAAADVEVAESFIGAMAVQIGAIGTIAFIGLMYQIIKKINENYQRSHNEFFLLCKALFYGLLVSIFFSESSVTIMGTGIYFILLGIATRKSWENEQTEGPHEQQCFSINNNSNL